jgi:hypothetical protein
MNKYLSFECQGKTYEVEFDRETFVKAEQSGFDINRVLSQPLSQSRIAMRLGLNKNHPNLNERIFKEVFDEFCDTYGIDEFLGFVGESYASFMTTTQQSSEKKNLNILQR